MSIVSHIWLKRKEHHRLNLATDRLIVHINIHCDRHPALLNWMHIVKDAQSPLVLLKLDWEHGSHAGTNQNLQRVPATLRHLTSVTA